MPDRNARTTFHGRVLIIERYCDDWPEDHIASAMGISRKCVSTWVTRYEAEGKQGLHDRSSRPHTMPTRTSPAVEERIVELRIRERSGPDWLAAELAVPARTICRVLRRHGVQYLTDCDPIHSQQILRSGDACRAVVRDLETINATLRNARDRHRSFRQVSRYPCCAYEISTAGVFATTKACKAKANRHGSGGDRRVRR